MPVEREKMDRMNCRDGGENVLTIFLGMEEGEILRYGAIYSMAITASHSSRYLSLICLSVFLFFCLPATAQVSFMPPSISAHSCNLP